MRLVWFGIFHISEAVIPLSYFSGGALLVALFEWLYMLWESFVFNLADIHMYV